MNPQHALLVAIIPVLLIAILSYAKAMTMANPSQPNLQDASLTLTRALPSAASTTVTSATSIDTGVTSSVAIQPGQMEFILTAPALNTTQLPDTRTVTYNIIVSAAANLGTPTTLLAAAIVQTGAGGAGAAAASTRFRIPSALPGSASRYIGFTAVTGASTGDCSAASATLALAV